MKTYQIKEKEVERKWHLMDASNQVLGRLSTQIARLLMGKHKPKYTNHIDTGDFVVVINAKKVILTGRKAEQKVYRRHSGYPGGLKTVAFKDMFEKNPRKVIEMAVKGMLPNNRLLKERLNRLKIFIDEKHPFENKLNN